MLCCHGYHHFTLLPYRHLDGAVFDTLTRPHVLVMDTRNAMVRPERRKERDQMFVSELYLPCVCVHVCVRACVCVVYGAIYVYMYTWLVHV